MSLFKRLWPKSLLWRLSLLNVLVITATITISSWAIYETACFLAGGIGNFSNQRQQQFNMTLQQYLWIFGLIGLLVGSMLHYYLIKKLIRPIRKMIDSTKQLKKGEFPSPIKIEFKDEVGELVNQYNGLISQLKVNEEQRTKVVADVSHEFRTPLANLNGYLQGLATGDLEGNKALYESLYHESKRLTHLIEQLEQLNQWDDVISQSYTNKQTVDLQEEINQCVNMFDWLLEKKNISVIQDVERSHVVIHVEGIHQVTSNLIDNAIQYYDGSGPIRITGKQLGEAYCVTIAGPSEPIPFEARKRIFERFYRVDASRQRDRGGSGLGLAIAKEIIEHHGGNIGVTSANGINHFSFTLPTTLDEKLAK